MQATLDLVINIQNRNLNFSNTVGQTFQESTKVKTENVSIKFTGSLGAVTSFTLRYHT